MMKKWTKLLSVFALAGAMTFGTFLAAGCNKKPDGDNDSDQFEQGGLDVYVTDVRLTAQSNTMTVGATMPIISSVLPSDATNKDLTWSSSDESVATVSTGGVVTAIKAGVVTITATASNNIAGQFTITVTNGQGGDDNPDVAVTEVKLTAQSTTIAVGATTTVNAAVSPDNATDKSLTWSSSDESIATVSTTGVVTAVKAGSVTITAKASNNVSGQITITVTGGQSSGDVAVTEVKLTAQSTTLTVGASTTVSATVSPDNATDKALTWSSSDNSVATVSTSGVVTAVKAGTVTITAKTSNNVSGQITITVTGGQSSGDVAVTEVKLTAQSTTLTVGATTTVNAAVSPDNATDKALTWSSSDNSVATVSTSGVVTAVKAGSVTITAKASNNVSGQITITITDGQGGDDNPDGKMSEADFKAAIEATLAATNFTYKTDSSTLKIDTAKDACAYADGSYHIYDNASGKIIEYNPLMIEGAWGKEIISSQLDNAAQFKELVTVGISENLNWFKSNYSLVTYDSASGKYSIGKAYITFANGKVSSFSKEDVGGVEISAYGTTDVTVPDFTNAFENIVSINIAKNEVITKLPLKGDTYGLYADDALMTTSTDYVEVTANGYKQKVTTAEANNKGTIISFAKLEGKIEGYFEFSASKVGSKNDMLCLRSGGAKILSLRTGDDSKNLNFNKKVGDGDTAKITTLSGLTPAAATVYKVRYTFVKGANGNYKADITINGVAFASGDDLGVETLDGFTLGCSNAKVDTSKNTTVEQNVRLITVDNVIICGTPEGGSVVNVAAITLDKYEARIETIGDTVTITPTVTPDNATNKNLVWSSSNESVATVDATGKVTAKAKGTATITVKASNGKTAQCVVTVGEVKAMYTVKFISEGKEVDKQTAEEGGKVLKPTGEIKEGYTLKWAVGSVNGAIFDFDTPITEDLTLYAVWEKGEDPKPDDPKPTNPPIQNAKISYYNAGNEYAAFEWEDNNAADAKVYYKLHNAGTYTEVDSQLIRQIDDTTARVDILGLKGNGNYDFKITTSGNEDLTQDGVTVSAYDRSGFAHFNYTQGVGAYNDDGTLKDNAIVLYVTDKNKNTVSLTYGGVTVTGIGNILNSVGENMGNTNQGIIKKLAEANIPLVVRFIGCVSNTGLYKQGTFNASSTPLIEGLTIYNSTGNGGTAGDNGHMARMKSGKDITLEGVGEDAVIDGWGFHFMAESSFAAGGKSFEVRNLTFINTPEDAIGMEGVQESKNASSKLSASVERCWIHNNEFYGPHISSPAESDKSEGDGSCDFKRGQYLTVSYNYFEGCHKTNLVGSADYSLQFNLTYHHNYWKLCKARGPLARRANIHMYNNVFEGQTDYAMNTRADAYIFSEYNLFYMCKSPQAVEGGAIKSYNDSVSSYLVNKGSMGTVVTSKSQKVPNNCQFAAENINYSEFDTNPNQSYIPTNNYILQTDVTEARKTIAALTGVRQSEYRSAADIDLSEVSVVPDDVTPTKITTYPSEVNPGKINKKPYAFTIDRSATVTVTCSGDGVLVNEAGVCLLDGNGSVNLEPGTYMVQPVNFQPGDAGTVTVGTFKELTIDSISFEEYKSEEFNAKLLADYNTKAGKISLDGISYDNASYQLILNAKNAYDILSPELKAQVEIPYTNVTEALAQYINLGKAEVERLINAIGTVTKNSGSDISKARAAYQALMKVSSDVTISNYKTLEQAEADYEQFEVLGLNDDIENLGALSANMTEQQMRDLLEAYEKVKTRYEDLDAEKKSQVEGYSKVTTGITAIQNALKPYDVRGLLEDLPESSAADYLAKVGELKAAYEALNDTQKGVLTAAEKNTIEAAIKAYDEYMSQAVTISFTSSHDNYYTKSSVSSHISVSGKTAAVTETYNSVSYTSGIKIESATTITIKASSTERKIVLHFASGAGGSIQDSDGNVYNVASDGTVTITLAANKSITLTKKDGTKNVLFLVEILPV